jgi:hypothetical protein
MNTHYYLSSFTHNLKNIAYAKLKNHIINQYNLNSVDSYKFAPMNPYYRMFVHRISEYFGLAHNVDQAKQFIIVNKTDKTKM